MESRDSLIDDIIAREYEQFDKVQNRGGRADCQDNPREFDIMRRSQFLQWPVPLLESYRSDLIAASETGRNLLAEKYARMMEYTYPEEYEQLKDRLPELTEESRAIIDECAAAAVEWHAAFARDYPAVASYGRATSGTAGGYPSVEVYLRGELGTYSPGTLKLYLALVRQLRQDGVNLAEQTVSATARLCGLPGLDALESRLRR